MLWKNFNDSANGSAFCRTGEPMTGVAGPLITALLRQGTPIRVPVTGSSMAPLIRSGDTVTVAPAEECSPGRGDLIVFVNRCGAPVLHRIVKIVGTGTGTVFRTKGDAQGMFDEPVAPGAVLGRVGAHRAPPPGTLGRRHRSRRPFLAADRPAVGGFSPDHQPVLVRGGSPRTRGRPERPVTRGPRAGGGPETFSATGIDHRFARGRTWLALHGALRYIRAV